MIENLNPVMRMVRTNTGMYIGPFWSIGTITLTTTYLGEMNDIAMRFILNRDGLSKVDFTDIHKLPTVDPTYFEYTLTVMGAETALGRGAIFHGKN